MALPLVLGRATVVLTGIFAGFLVGVLVLELSLREQSAATYVTVRLVELDALDQLASATLLPAVVGAAGLVAVSWRLHGERAATVGVLALLLAVLAVSLAVNVPINQDQDGWSPTSPPSDWEATRDTWLAAHAVRTVAAVAAFVWLALHHRESPGPTARPLTTEEIHS